MMKRYYYTILTLVACSFGSVMMAAADSDAENITIYLVKPKHGYFIRANINDMKDDLMAIAQKAKNGESFIETLAKNKLEIITLQGKKSNYIYDAMSRETAKEHLDMLDRDVCKVICDNETIYSYYTSPKTKIFVPYKLSRFSDIGHKSVVLLVQNSNRKKINVTLTTTAGIKLGSVGLHHYVKETKLGELLFEALREIEKEVKASRLTQSIPIVLTNGQHFWKHELDEKTPLDEFVIKFDFITSITFIVGADPLDKDKDDVKEKNFMEKVKWFWENYAWGTPAGKGITLVVVLGVPITSIVCVIYKFFVTKKSTSTELQVSEAEDDQEEN